MLIHKADQQIIYILKIINCQINFQKMQSKAWQNQSFIFNSFIFFSQGQRQIMITIRHRNEIYESIINGKNSLLMKLYDNNIEDCFKQIYSDQGDLTVDLVDDLIVIKYQINVNVKGNVMNIIKLKTKRYILNSITDRQQAKVNSTILKYNQDRHNQQMRFTISKLSEDFQKRISKLQQIIKQNIKQRQQDKKLQGKRKKAQLQQCQVVMPLSVQHADNLGKYSVLESHQDWFLNEKGQELLVLNNEEEIGKWYSSIREEYASSKHIIQRTKINLNQYHINQQRYDIVFGLVKSSRIEALKQRLNNYKYKEIEESISLVYFNYDFFVNLLNNKAKIQLQTDLQEISNVQIMIQCINDGGRWIMEKVSFLFNGLVISELKANHNDPCLKDFNIQQHIPYIYIYHSIRHFSVKSP